MLIGNGMLIDKVLLTRLGQHWNNFARQEVLPISTVDGFGALAGIPDGYYGQAAFAMPRRAGRMSAVNTVGLQLDGQAAGAMGVNIVGAASIAIDAAPAFGQLIVSGSGSASFSINATGTVVASLTTTGSASMTFSGSGSIGALAFGTGAASVTLNGSLTPYAVGHMVGSTVDSGVLTPDSVAQAVWARIIESGYSAEEILRLVAGVSAGDATGLESGSPSFKSLDGSKVRVAGSYVGGVRTVTTLDGG